jgi:hypothetical protein
MEVGDDIVPPLSEGDAIFRELKSHHDKNDVLRRLGLSK